jgi:hypothetical protein
MDMAMFFPGTEIVQDRYKKKVFGNQFIFL